MTRPGPQQVREMLQKRFTHLCWKISRGAVSVLGPLLPTEYDKITLSQCKFVISCEGSLPQQPKGEQELSVCLNEVQLIPGSSQSPDILTSADKP